MDSNIVAKSAPARPFYFTFGQKYREVQHPCGWHPDGWVVIEAPNESAARAKMVAMCGTAWAFCYSKPPESPLYRRGELARFSTAEDSEAEPSNYIRVDEDELDGIVRVYDDSGEVYIEFSGDPRDERRQKAERAAAREAKRLGCEWGTNYF